VRKKEDKTSIKTVKKVGIIGTIWGVIVLLVGVPIFLFYLFTLFKIFFTNIDWSIGHKGANPNNTEWHEEHGVPK